MFEYKLFLIEGLYFELMKAPEDKEYLVKFLDGENVLYETVLKTGYWAKCNRRYLCNYFVEIWDGEVLMERISFIDRLKGNKVFISFESKSLGDTIAWMHYCQVFKKTYQCKVVVSTFLNELFENEYPELEFVGRGVVVHNIVAMLQIGWFWNKSMEPEHPVTIPLQKAATNILYLPFTEVAPRISYVYNDRPIEQKYVAISTQSTSQLKLWDYWADLIELLHKEGYAVYEVSKDDCNLDVIQPEDRSLQNVMNIIKHAEFYIGLSSGISWLAWALGADVVMISNFTNADHEFTDCTRIVDTSVCHGCWNNPKFKFDKGNWMWCPKHEDTKRQFECHKVITAQHVFDKIKY